MPVTINGSNTPTAGGVTYGDGTQYATTSAGTSGQALVSAGAGAPAFGTLGIAGGGTNSTATPTAGGVGYGTGSAHAYTSAGTSGQVLTSAGSGAPTWSTPSAGAMTFLESVTASSSTTVELTALTSTYDMYMVVGSNITTSAANDFLRLRVVVGGTTQTTNYRTNSCFVSSATTTIGNENADTTYMLINRGTTGANGCNFVLYIGTPANTTLYKAITWQTFGTTPAPINTYQFGSGVYIGGTGAVTKLNFGTVTGNIAAGTFRLYGISNS